VLLTKPQIIAVSFVFALLLGIAVYGHLHPPDAVSASTPRGSSYTYRLVRIAVNELPGERSNQSLGLNTFSENTEAYTVYIFKHGRDDGNCMLAFEPDQQRGLIYEGNESAPRPVSCSRPEDAIDKFLAGKVPAVPEIAPGTPIRGYDQNGKPITVPYPSSPLGAQ
jgi:hypothetical protein